jgi:hypothetical protein
LTHMSGIFHSCYMSCPSHPPLLLYSLCNSQQSRGSRRNYSTCRPIDIPSGSWTQNHISSSLKPRVPYTLMTHNYKFSPPKYWTSYYLTGSLWLCVLGDHESKYRFMHITSIRQVVYVVKIVLKNI